MTAPQIAWVVLVAWLAFNTLIQVLDVGKPPRIRTNKGALFSLLINLAEIGALLLIGQPTNGNAWIWWAIIAFMVYGTMVSVSRIGKVGKELTGGIYAFLLVFVGLLLLGLWTIRPF